MTRAEQIRTYINRLARLDAAESWAHELNPSQTAVIDYLAVANRFSRSPSHVASFLGTTRGTVSQTLKALQTKGYVSETRSEFDKRSISFTLTEAGRAFSQRELALAQTVEGLGEADAQVLERLLADMLHSALQANNGRAFGICQSCAHFSRRDAGGYCQLLKVALDAAETRNICHEHVATAG